MGGRNEVTIIVHTRLFSVIPALPEAVGGLEPFRVRADWSNANGAYRRITIRGFRDVDGYSLYTDPKEISFGSEEHMSYKDIRFASVTSDVFCKYDIVYDLADGSTIVFDPILLIRPR